MAKLEYQRPVQPEVILTALEAMASNKRCLNAVGNPQKKQEVQIHQTMSDAKPGVVSVKNRGRSNG